MCCSLDSTPTDLDNLVSTYGLYMNIKVKLVIIPKYLHALFTFSLELFIRCSISACLYLLEKRINAVDLQGYILFAKDQSCINLSYDRKILTFFILP